MPVLILHQSAVFNSFVVVSCQNEGPTAVYFPKYSNYIIFLIDPELSLVLKPLEKQW